MDKLTSLEKKKQLKSINSDFVGKTFVKGSYQFIMFQIDYYARVKKELKMDFDSFIIIQTVLSHTIHNLQKQDITLKTYSDLETEVEKIIRKKNSLKSNKLTISSICLVTGSPKETVRRKTNKLIKKNFLFYNKNEGINLGPNYKKIYSKFLPETTFEIKKLVKYWKKIGTLDDLLLLK
jgi:hypothetical protein